MSNSYSRIRIASICKKIFLPILLYMKSLQKLCQHFLHITLTILFFIIPLVYAWFYIPGISATLADIMPFLSGFEKVKVFFFLGLTTLAALFFLVSKKLTNNYLKILGVFLVWTVVSYTINRNTNPYFWFGNEEKFHGWYLYLGLVFLGIMLSASTREEQKKYLKISLFSGFIVCIYATFQKMGMDPLSTAYTSRLDSTRIFGTLGNPNYLAGYILMLLPLAFAYLRSRRTIISAITVFLLIMVLFWTKSFFGIGIFLVYLSYTLLYKYVPVTKQTRSIILYAALILLIWATGYGLYHYGERLLEIQKVKGFIARYFLWLTGINAIFWDMKNTLFGYGPDGFLPVSEIFRRPELSIFEDPAFRIDRSHNVWIDIIIHFGIPLGGLILYTISCQWKNLPLAHREVLVLFSIFFFFNIPVLVHFIILLQVLIISERPPEKLSS